MSNLSFDVVCMYDDAIVENVEDGAMLAKFAVERDLSLLDLPADAKPTVFKCRSLSRDVRRKIRDLGDETQNELAFRYGVVEVQNLRREDGTIESLTLPRHKPTDALSDEVLDSLGIPDVDISEVGSVVRTRSFLGHARRLKYPVLASSQLALEAAVYHRAVRRKDSETKAGS